MHIPSRLKIGGHIYKVSFEDPENIEHDCGIQNRARNTIKIRNDLPESQIQETYIHEILHALNGDLKEETVDFLAMAIYAFLKDNKYII